MKKTTFLGIIAFFALFLAGVMNILMAIVNLGSVGVALQLIADLLLVFTVVIAAYPFAKANKTNFWFIVYWVLTVLAIVGVVFGGVKLF